ncbi:MAG: glycosyltransferase, partial [Acidimicrobiales bacterium]
MGRVPPDEATVEGPRPQRADRALFVPQTPRSLRPDAAADPALYRRWRAAQDAWRLTVDPAPPPGPELTLLMVVDGTAEEGPDAVSRTLASVAQQTVGTWSLWITLLGAPGAGVDAAITAALTSDPAGLCGPVRHPGRFGPLSHPSKVARTGPPAHRGEPGNRGRPGRGGQSGRLQIRTSAAGTDVAAAHAAALEESASPAVTFVDPGDELSPDAVARLSAALIDADVAYADEDRFGPDGLASTPVLKPDWSPELLLSWSYLGRPVALRVAPLIAAGGIRPLPGGDWEHDLLLRVTERTERVAHVASVLCHRMGATRSSAGPAAVENALSRRGQPATVRPGPRPGTWSVRRRPGRGARTSVSAIVPFRDSTGLLRACARALRAAGAGADGNVAGTSVGASGWTIDLEVVLVDNGSTEPETATLLERLQARLRPDVDVLVRHDARPFNWAALNNAAAAQARGEVLLFVNDDVQGGTAGWMELLVVQALLPEVGAVGARLVYPDGRLQHAGIVLGLAGATGHVLAGLEAGLPGYLGMAVHPRDVTAVTGACMATRREVFDQLGGFDESLGLDFNDVDYCLRARSRGLRVVLEAGAELVHHESPSRGTSGSE